MLTDHSLLSFISNASYMVKVVMSILLGASIISWTMIAKRLALLHYVKKQTKDFGRIFNNSANLGNLVQILERQPQNLNGIARISYSGLTEYNALAKNHHPAGKELTEAIQRVMQIAQAKEFAILENNLSFLATIGSTSPYIGLFGTVWGIMSSFQALSLTQQATISMVAPGISEALIATAMGLFAAIPAVIAYNRFNSCLEQLANQYEIFQQQLLARLYREEKTI